MPAFLFLKQLVKFHPNIWWIFNEKLFTLASDDTNCNT